MNLYLPSFFRAKLVNIKNDQKNAPECDDRLRCFVQFWLKIWGVLGCFRGVEWPKWKNKPTFTIKLFEFEAQKWPYFCILAPINPWSSPKHLEFWVKTAQKPVVQMTWDQCQIISFIKNYNWTNFGKKNCQMILQCCVLQEVDCAWGAKFLQAKSSFILKSPIPLTSEMWWNHYWWVIQKMMTVRVMKKQQTWAMAKFSSQWQYQTHWPLSLYTPTSFRKIQLWFTQS